MPRLPRLQDVADSTIFATTLTLLIAVTTAQTARAAESDIIAPGAEVEKLAIGVVNAPAAAKNRLRELLTNRDGIVVVLKNGVIADGITI